MFTAILLLAFSCANPVWNETEANSLSPTVSSEVNIALIEKVATSYAKESWPNAKLISMVPYYELDGSVNAIACQFDKAGTGHFTDKILAEKVAQAETAYQSFYDANIKAEKTAAEGIGNRDTTGSATELGSTSEGVIASDPVTSNIDSIQLIKDREASLAALATQNTQLSNATVLANEVGTIIMAARYDLYPLLEKFDGVAQHVKELSKVKEISGYSRSADVQIAKTYYLGAFGVFHKVDATSKSSEPALVNALEKTIVPFQATRSGGKKVLSAAPHKIDITPKEVWDSFETKGIDLLVSRADDTDTIANVPYYHQDNYGANSCGPTASAQALGYWDTMGYGNLVDCGSSAPSSMHVGRLVNDLMESEGYSSTVGTYDNMIEPGIEAVCNTDKYGNNLNFDVVSKYSGISWSDIKGEINADRPFVYFNWDGASYPNWAHFTTGTGYNTTGYKLYVHYNYAPDSPYELNWLNIPSGNEEMFKINPLSGRFYCPWSEDFEGAFPGPWVLSSSGSTYWDDVTMRKHEHRGSSWGGHGTGYTTTYPASVYNSMTFGPFSTVGYSSGEVNFYLWRDMPDDADCFVFWASTDNSYFTGTRYWTNDKTWFRVTQNLATFYGGNYMNKPQVWFRFTFYSDSDATVGEGAYIDDPSIKLYY